MSVFALVAVSLITTGCYKLKQERKKPRNNSTECKYNVTALSPTSSVGHFSYSDNNGNYVLIAKNYADYQSKIVPGEDYIIGFYETDCGPINCVGDMRKPMWVNGSTTRCIVITCLTPKKKRDDNGENNGGSCLGATNDKVFEDKMSMGNGNSSVSGNKLTTNFHVRSYNPDEDLKNMVLYYNAEYIDKSMGPELIIPVRIVHKNADLFVNAQYEKRKCFDLTDLKNDILKVNNTVTKVVLSILQSDQSTVEKVNWTIQ